MNRKANMAFLGAFALTFVIAGIYLSLGATITDEFQKNYYYLNNTETNESLPAVWAVVPTNGYAYNITAKTQEGLWSISNRLPLVGLVVGIVLVIGYLKMVQ
jgi:hypothetical protein